MGLASRGSQAIRDVVNKGSAIGDGSTVTFALGFAPISADHLDIRIDGAWQEPAYAYTVSETNVTFTSPPANTSRIYWRSLGRTYDFFTPEDASVSLSKLQTNIASRVILADSGVLAAAANYQADAVFNAEYDVYEIVGVNVRPDTASQNLILQLGALGVIDTGATNYGTQSIRTSGAYDVDQDDSLNSIRLCHDNIVSTAEADGGVSFCIRVYSPFSTDVDTTIRGESVMAVSLFPQGYLLSGLHHGDTSDTDVRISFGTGNIASGRIRVYGLTNGSL